MVDTISPQVNLEEALRENLQRTLTLLNNNKELADEYNKINNIGPGDEKCWYGITVRILGIISPVIVLYLYWNLVQVDIFEKTARLFIVFPLAFIPAFLICDAASMLCTYRAKKTRDFRVAAENERIIQLQEQYKKNMELLDTFSVVPAMYRYVNAVELILHYAINRRADTIKEAINLYEAEWQGRERLEELRNIRRANLKILNEIQDNKQKAVIESSSVEKVNEL